MTREQLRAAVVAQMRAAEEYTKILTEVASNTEQPVQRRHHGPCNEHCRGCDKPSDPPKPERRFCMCGQEVMGRRFDQGLLLCGDCDRECGRLKKSIPLDRRIRDAQPDVVEHAWQTPAAEGP